MIGHHNIWIKLFCLQLMLWTVQQCDRIFLYLWISQKYRLILWDCAHSACEMSSQMFSKNSILCTSIYSLCSCSPWAHSRKQQFLLWGQNFFAVWENIPGSVQQKFEAEALLKGVNSDSPANLAPLFAELVSDPCWFPPRLPSSLVHLCWDWRKGGCPGRFVFYLILGFVFLLLREEEKVLCCFWTHKPNTLS